MLTLKIIFEWSGTKLTATTFSILSLHLTQKLNVLFFTVLGLFMLQRSTARFLVILYHSYPRRQSVTKPQLCGVRTRQVSIMPIWLKLPGFVHMQKNGHACAYVPLVSARFKIPDRLWQCICTHTGILIKVAWKRGKGRPLTF